MCLRFEHNYLCVMNNRGLVNFPQIGLKTYPMYDINHELFLCNFSSFTGGVHLQKCKYKNPLVSCGVFDP